MCTQKKYVNPLLFLQKPVEATCANRGGLTASIGFGLSNSVFSSQEFMSLFPLLREEIVTDDLYKGTPGFAGDWLREVIFVLGSDEI